MRRFLFIVILCFLPIFPVVSQDTQQDDEKPDYFATATALIVGATETAAASQNEQESYKLTATRLIQNITQTADASGEIADTYTPDPDIALATEFVFDELEVTVTPTQDAFSATSTKLVQDITATVEKQTGATAIPVDVAGSDNKFEITATALIAQATQNASAGDTEPASTSDNASLPGLLITALLGILGLFGIVGAGLQRKK